MKLRLVKIFRDLLTHSDEQYSEFLIVIKLHNILCLLADTPLKQEQKSR